MNKKKIRKGRAVEVRDLSVFAAAVLFVASNGKAKMEKVVRYEKATYRNGDTVCVLELA